MTAIPAEKIHELRKGAAEDGSGKSSSGRGNAALGKEDLAGIADEMTVPISINL